MWKRWTIEDDNYIKRHWDMPNDVIATALDRTVYSIRHRRNQLGIPSEDWEGIKIPVAMSKSEKEMRIIKMASEMRVRLLG